MTTERETLFQFPRVRAALAFSFRPRSALLVSSVVVAGYAGSAVASRATHADWSNRPELYTMTYLGRPLHCLVVEDGAAAGRIGGLSCDFVRYWRGRR